MCSFALLYLCFISFAKQVHQRSPLPGTTMSNTSPPPCHRASFPKGKFWSNKAWVWHLVGTSGIHKGLLESSAMSAEYRHPLHTAHTVHLSLSRSSGFTVPVLDRLFMGMGWNDMSQKHCTHGTSGNHMCHVWQWDQALSLHIWPVTLLNQEEFFTLAHPSITVLHRGTIGQWEQQKQNRH